MIDVDHDHDYVVLEKSSEPRSILSAGFGQDKRQRLYRALKGIARLLGFIIFISILLALIFSITEPPHRGPLPEITLIDVKLYALNVSTTTSTLQIALSSRNPSWDEGIRFEKVDVYASYRNQQITLPTMVPPMYLAQSDMTGWSLYLNGTDVLVTPDLAAALAQDKTAGYVLITVKVTGELSSDFEYSSHLYRLEVNCPAYIMFGNKTDGKLVGSVVKKCVEVAV